MSSEEVTYNIIRELSEMPPNGWRYVDPDTGYEIVKMSLGDLKPEIYEHRVGNQLISPDDEGWWIEAQLHMCATGSIPEAWCGAKRKGLTKWKSHTVDHRKVLRFFKLVRRWAAKWKGELPFVSSEEANARAKICAGCPFNVPIDSCPGCVGVFRFLKKLLTPNQVTPYDEKLKACGVCGCSLRIKIHVPQDLILEADNGEVPYPDWCSFAVKKKLPPV